MRLTLEQRAKRNAIRKNNAIRRRWPLFAEQFATETTDSQIENPQRQEAATLRWQEVMKQHNLAAWQKGMERRDVVSRCVEPDVLAELDAKFNSYYGGKGIYSQPEHKGYECADFWWQAVKRHALMWAQDHCPNEKYHTAQCLRTDDGHCPTCGRTL